MEILRRLADSPSHGYQLHKELGVSTPVIYQHLDDLESEGVVESTAVEDSDRDRVEYQLTEKGSKLLELLDE